MHGTQRRRLPQLFVTLVLGLCLSLAWPARSQDDAKSDAPAKLKEAQRLLWTGKYAEAVEQFEKLREVQPISAALGLARCQTATGKLDKSEETLRGAIKGADTAALLE